MSSVGLIASIAVGPWLVPQKAQTCVINSYANGIGIDIDHMVSEFVFGHDFPHLISLLQENNIKNIIFFSAYQLLRGSEFERYIDHNLTGMKLHFALEDICVLDKHGLHSLLLELDFFNNMETLNADHKLLEI